MFFTLWWGVLVSTPHQPTLKLLPKSRWCPSSVMDEWKPRGQILSAAEAVAAEPHPRPQLLAEDLSPSLQNWDVPILLPFLKNKQRGLTIKFSGRVACLVWTDLRFYLEQNMDHESPISSFQSDSRLPKAEDGVSSPTGVRVTACFTLMA